MTVTMLTKAANMLKSRNRNAKDSEELTVGSLAGGSSHASADRQARKEEECLRKLTEECRVANISASNNTIFRFACYHDFKFEIALAAIFKKYNDDSLHIRMEDKLEEQFHNLVIFPLPGLMTKKNDSEVLYFHAARHFTATMDTELLVRNMIYIFNDMSLTEQQCRNGVALIIDCNKFSFKNFTPECSNKFFKALEHQVPTKVEALLVVNAPKWFPKVYRHLFRKMMSKSFQKKFHILKRQQQLQDYLAEGYEKFLPVEMGYSVDSTEIIEDFIDWKRHNESKQ